MDTNKTTVIRGSGLTKVYGSLKALDGVSFSVRRGDVYGLIGDNGAGKTTLLKAISGQIFLTGGELSLFGEGEARARERQRKRMGALIEDAAFYPQLTVEENVNYYRLQKGVPGKKAVEEALSITGLLEHRKKKCKGLSMGMKQRLGLAIALIGEPELLVLDEPINGLDPSGIVEMRELLKRLNKEKNITILMSSHILSELHKVAGVYGFLSRGQLLEQISDRELEKRCSAYLEIRVDRPEAYTALLEKELGYENYRVMPDGSVHIFGAGEEIGRFSALAARHEIAILRFDRVQQSLEDYYLKLKTGGRL